MIHIYFRSDGALGDQKTTVEIGTGDESKDNTVLKVFLEELDQYDLGYNSRKEKFPIFIGYGHSDAWEKLKDHLREKHNYCNIISYERDGPMGATTTKTLNQMKKDSSIAILVHSADVRLKTGDMQARQNVAHETGLFQNYLGAERTLIVRERSCREDSNILGVNQIIYDENNIASKFGDIVAAINKIFEKTASV